MKVTVLAAADVLPRPLQHQTQALTQSRGLQMGEIDVRIGTIMSSPIQPWAKTG